jgi:hypothetical protein
MTRLALAAALLAAAAEAGAQLVPVTRCNSAIPCSIPFGLRPAGAAAWTPGAKVGQGNTAVSVSAGVEEGLKPKIDRSPVSEDPVEAAARMYVRRNPAPPTPKPTPAASPKSTAHGPQKP